MATPYYDGRLEVMRHPFHCRRRNDMQDCGRMTISCREAETKQRTVTKSELCDETKPKQCKEAEAKQETATRREEKQQHIINN